MWLSASATALENTSVSSAMDGLVCRLIQLSDARTRRTSQRKGQLRFLRNLGEPYKQASCDGHSLGVRTHPFQGHPEKLTWDSSHLPRAAIHSLDFTRLASCCTVVSSLNPRSAATFCCEPTFSSLTHSSETRLYVSSAKSRAYSDSRCDCATSRG